MFAWPNVVRTAVRNKTQSSRLAPQVAFSRAPTLVDLETVLIQSVPRVKKV